MTRDFSRQSPVINTFNSKRTSKSATVPSIRRKYTGTTVWTRAGFGTVSERLK
jgi:hypothetical protein